MSRARCRPQRDTSRGFVALLERASIRHLEGDGLRGVTSKNPEPMSPSGAPPTESSGTLSLTIRSDHFDRHPSPPSTGGRGSRTPRAMPPAHQGGIGINPGGIGEAPMRTSFTAAAESYL